jgi:hypothetical protein
MYAQKSGAAPRRSAPGQGARLDFRHFFAILGRVPEESKKSQKRAGGSFDARLILVSGRPSRGNPPAAADR